MRVVKLPSRRVMKSKKDSPARDPVVTLLASMLIALVGATIGVYVQMGSVRVDVIDRIATLQVEMSKEHTEIRERLAALESKVDIQRSPERGGNGGQ